MWGVNMIGDSGEIKGVALWVLVQLSSVLMRSFIFLLKQSAK